MPPCNAALASAAAAVLRRCGHDRPADYSVTVECAGESHTYRFAAEPRTDADLGAGPGLWLSPLEQRIVGALAGRGWVSTAALAESMGEAADNDFRVVVRNLSERNILETSTRHGVRLTGGLAADS